MSCCSLTLSLSLSLTLTLTLTLTAGKNELEIREHMDTAREGSSSIRSTGAEPEGGVNWAKDNKGGKDAVRSRADVN